MSQHYLPQATGLHLSPVIHSDSTHCWPTWIPFAGPHRPHWSTQIPLVQSHSTDVIIPQGPNWSPQGLHWPTWTPLVYSDCSLDHTGLCWPMWVLLVHSVTPGLHWTSPAIKQHWPTQTVQAFLHWLTITPLAKPALPLNTIEAWVSQDRCIWVFAFYRTSHCFAFVIVMLLCICYSTSSLFVFSLLLLCPTLPVSKRA